MAVASTKTKLPLTTWAKLMGVHPLHFEQVSIPTLEQPFCDQIMFQHSWQTSQHVSREEIATAIAEAEAQIENYLQYRLMPTWEYDEWQKTTRPYQKDLFNLNDRDVRGFQQTVNANWGYFISGGIEAKTLVEAGATIVYTDEDGDGYFETATVSVATSVTDSREIAAYYPGKSAADEWEIRPVEVSIASGIATITFRREQAVDSDLFERFNIEGAEANGLDDSDFLDTVDIYRHWNYPQTQATMLWEPGLNMCAQCNGELCPRCAYAAQTACLLVRGDPRQSILAYHAADWSVDDQAFSNTPCCLERQPDIVRLFYYSGYRNMRLPYTNRMDPEWQRVVAYMATAKLERPPCDCMSGFWDRWAQDMTLVAGDESGKPFFRTPDGILDNPFGTRRGEVYAWRKVKDHMRGRAVHVL